MGFYYWGPRPISAYQRRHGRLTMANVPIAGVSYHHDGLPKPMSVHCLGQNFNKAPVQRFATRAITNMVTGGPNNIPFQPQQQQSVRYVGVQPCVQHVHPNQQPPQQYMMSNNIPRKYVNVNGGMNNQQNIRWENGPIKAGHSPVNMNGNYQYEIVNNCVPSNMQRNNPPSGNMAAYRTSNAPMNAAMYQQNGNAGNSNSNIPSEMGQQNVNFDMNGNLLVNQNRTSSIVTFNNGQLKINDGQLTLNEGQIIFNGGHVRMNPSSGVNHGEHKMNHQQMMESRFGQNMMHVETPIRGNIRVENQIRQGPIGNMPPYQINTKVEGQFSTNISPYAGHSNMNTSRYKLTHLPLQKVKNQIIQNNTMHTTHNVMKPDPSLFDQKPHNISAYQEHAQPRINERQYPAQNNDTDDECIYPRQSINEVPIKYEDEKRNNVLYSPTYEPSQYKTEDYFNDIKKPSPYTSTSIGPALSTKETVRKPWLDQSDLSDTLKKVRPVWFKGDLNSPKVEQQDLYAMDIKKRKIEPSNYENENSTEEAKYMPPNRCNELSENLMNNKPLFTNEPLPKMYRKDCEMSSIDQSGTNASCDGSKNASTKVQSPLPTIEPTVKIKEEEIDTTEKTFSQSFSYKNGTINPKTGFYEHLVPPQHDPSNNTLSHFDHQNGGMNTSSIKCPLDTPKISRAFFNETNTKMESGLDYLDEPPPLIKVEIF